MLGGRFLNFPGALEVGFLILGDLETGLQACRLAKSSRVSGTPRTEGTLTLEDSSGADP